MTQPAGATFSTRRVQASLGISRGVLAGLVRAGYVVPGRGARDAWTFTFTDLMLLRTALTLQEAGISSRKTLRALARLRRRTPAELPLTGLRLTAVGDDVAVRAVDGRLEAPSGQLLMDFTVAPVEGVVTFIDRRASSATTSTSASTSANAGGPDPAPLPDRPDDPWNHFRAGEAFEADEPLKAEQAYREALRCDPSHVSAYLNLGSLLCEAGRCEAAVDLYEEAFRHCAPTALLLFNQAVALEDLGRIDAAIGAYDKCLALDPTLADAHFNLGRLHEIQGDRRKALRHFGTYRRLQP